MKKSNGKTIYGSLYKFEPGSQNMSFKDIKDFLLEIEHFENI